MRLARALALPCLMAAAALLFYGRGLGETRLAVDDAQTAALAYASWNGLPCFCPRVRILGHWLPLAYTPYTGPWTIYSFWPFLLIRDPMLAVGLFAVAWAALAVVAVYLAGLIMSGSALSAALAALAAAAWPFMNEAVKLGFSPSGIVAVPWGLAGLAGLAWASKRRSLAAWYLSCASIGLGVAFFIHGLGFLAAWALSTAWLRRELRPVWARGRLVPLVSSLLLFSASAPLLLANWLTDWFSADFIARHLAVSANGFRNADYLGNMLIRLRELPQIFGQPRAWAAGMAGLFAATAYRLAKARLRPAQREPFIPLISLAAFLAVSPFTLASLDLTHVVGLYPLALLAVACLSGTLALPRRFSAAPQLLLSLILISNVVAIGLRKVKVSAYSPVGPVDLPEVSQWLLKQAPAMVISLSESVPPPSLMWLTQRGRVGGRIAPWRPEPGSVVDVPGPIERLLASRDRVYLLAGADSQAALSALGELCRRRGRRLRLLKEFPAAEPRQALRIFEETGARPG